MTFAAIISMSESGFSLINFGHKKIHQLCAINNTTIYLFSVYNFLVGEFFVAALSAWVYTADILKLGKKKKQLEFTASTICELNWIVCLTLPAHSQKTLRKLTHTVTRICQALINTELSIWHSYLPCITYHYIARSTVLLFQTFAAPAISVNIFIATD